MTTWIWRPFQKLKPAELYDILALRQEVFMLEQHCLYEDLDYKDHRALHLMGKQKNKLVAYLRLLPKNIPYPDAISFGRVVTAPSIRGQDIGKQLIQQVLNYLEKKRSRAPIIISAQLYLEKLYQSFSFKSVDKPYNEDGIPHIKMIKHDK